MKTPSEDYNLLSRDSSDDSGVYSPNPRWSRPRYFKALFVAFLVSIGINILSGIKYTLRGKSHLQTEKLLETTRFAGLTWNTPKTFDFGGLYDNANETLTNDAWASINYDRGSMALSDEYAMSMGLPLAQRFPWDESKGLYFLSSHHSLHCLTILHTVMHELRDGKPLSFSFSHSMHCLDTLVQDVKCFADDTPRYESVEHPAQPGFGQARICRDWDALEAWSEQHTSCWKDVNPAAKHIDTLIRYKFCPPGSPYYEAIHRVFGDFTDDEAGPILHG